VTKLVAYGVLLEGPELAYELWTVFARWRKKVVPEHTPAWITIVGLVGWILVAVGVGGEFWVDATVNSDDEQIRVIDEQLLGDARTAASDAAVLASNASASASNAETKSGDAVGKAKSADTVASNALSSANEAVQRIAASEGEIEKLEGFAQTTQFRQMGRQILDERFQPHLKGVRKADVQIVYVPEDGEAYSLAGQLQSSLNVAGWNVTEMRALQESDAIKFLKHEFNRPGIPLVIRAGAAGDLTLQSLVPPHDIPAEFCSICALAKALADGLRISREPDINSNPDLPANSIRVVIDHKW
jgi:hypothetical protein